MHLLPADGVPAADCAAQLGDSRSLVPELLPETWKEHAGTELCQEPHLSPSVLGFQLSNPSLMCNHIYLFISLLFDAMLLTERLPLQHPQPREEGGCARCMPGSRHGHRVGICFRRERLRLNQKYFPWGECAKLSPSENEEQAGQSFARKDSCRIHKLCKALLARFSLSG